MTEDNTYTTGELADACGTTVRTVQYYDQKGLLVPSGYSEGGRRMYADGDTERLRFILMLKTLGLKLSQIRGILESPNRGAILETLLEERASQLKDEIARSTTMLDGIKIMQSDLELCGHITMTSQAAMDTRMNDEKAWKRWAATMIVIGICMDIAWIGTLVYGIVPGTWWPFPIALVFVAVAGFWTVSHFGAHATYLCPVCKAKFRPRSAQRMLCRPPHVHDRYGRPLHRTCSHGHRRWNRLRCRSRALPRLTQEGAEGMTFPTRDDR